MKLQSINPYTGKVIHETEEYSESRVDSIITESQNAFTSWKNTSPEHQKSLMENVADLLRRNIDEYALTITSEMGKPLRESRAEIEKCAWACEYYAQNAENFLSPEPAATDADVSYVRYEPLGVILGIMPWNFPFWQVFRFAVPTIMAGNTVLLKHASNVQMCANQIESIFIEAGFNTGIFRNIAIGSAGVERIIRNDLIKAVSLTGSEEAGQKVAQVAGSVVKKTVLELGGSNSFIVLRDANIQKAADEGIKARFQNAGQSCISSKRFIVDEKVSGEFISLFLEKIRKLITGDPLREDTDLGPLSSDLQAKKVEEQVKKSIDSGARLLYGGKRDKAFFQPSLLTNVKPGMPLFDEEVFGPVVPVTEVKNTTEAITLANMTNFGLGVTLFTGNTGYGEELSKEFQDGSVFINSLVKSDPRLPFGGTKHSGYGRELAMHGIREFVNVKTLFIRK